MRLLRLVVKGWIYLLGLVILVGCSGSSKEREAVINFDGETVQYQGPVEISPGDMKVTLNNQSEYSLDVFFLELEDGKNWQDMLDYVGIPGSDVPPPPWVTNSTKMGVANDPNAFIYPLQQGSYAVVLCRCNEILAPTQIWPVTAFEVEE